MGLQSDRWVQKGKHVVTLAAPDGAHVLPHRWSTGETCPHTAGILTRSTKGGACSRTFQGHTQWMGHDLQSSRTDSPDANEVGVLPSQELSRHRRPRKVSGQDGLLRRGWAHTGLLFGCSCISWDSVFMSLHRVTLGPQWERKPVARFQLPLLHRYLLACGHGRETLGGLCTEPRTSTRQVFSQRPGSACGPHQGRSWGWSSPGGGQESLALRRVCPSPRPRPHLRGGQGAGGSTHSLRFPADSDGLGRKWQKLAILKHNRQGRHEVGVLFLFWMVLFFRLWCCLV